MVQRVQEGVLPCELDGAVRRARQLQLRQLVHEHQRLALGQRGCAPPTPRDDQMTATLIKNVN